MCNDIVFQHVIAQTTCDREDAHYAALEDKTTCLFNSSNFEWIVEAVIVRKSDPLALVAQDNA